MRHWLLAVAVVLFAVGCGKTEDASKSATPAVENHSGHQHDKATENVAHGEKVKDLICGMDIPKDKAKTFTFGNTTLYFCSDGCMNKFASAHNVAKEGKYDDNHKDDDSKKIEKVKDIVCGMTVEKDKAKTLEYRKEKFYFCSNERLEKFKKEPKKYPTGLSGEPCVCRKDMPGCGCGHCKGKDEKCECGKEEKHDEHKH